MNNTEKSRAEDASAPVRSFRWRRAHLAFAVALAVYLLLGGGLSLLEWYRVAVVASPEVLAQYPFGSEGPVAGNASYASASAYGRSALRTWLFSFALLGVVLVATRQKSGVLLAGCYVLFVLAWFGRATSVL